MGTENPSHKLKQQEIFRLMMRRTIAAVIDYTIFALLVLMYIALVGERAGPGEFHVEGMRHLFPIVLTWVVYFPVLEAVLGYSPGKGLLDLRVIDNNSLRRATFFQTLMRHMLDPADIVLFTMFVIVTVHQGVPRRLGDLLAGTKVMFDERYS